MKKALRSIEIETGVSSDFLENTLTRDISTLEALYDLVDNSIDAARNSILQGKYEIDEHGLPLDYSKYEISIEIGADEIKTSDNCFGIDESTLIKKALYTANRSNHPYGIGHFGLGLKRSLLKMGTHYEFKIDNGENMYISKFNNSNIGDASQKLAADVFESEDKVGVTFCVRDLKTEIREDIQNRMWLDNAREGFTKRYAIYLEKGLKIRINSSPDNQAFDLHGKIPKIRTDGKFLPKTRKLKFGGIDVIIRSGIHEDYTFPSEKNYSLPVNRTLTESFGIYFICNDRVVVSASTSSEHGWKAKWHSEYNGYVCHVIMVSEDPSFIPWNTSKTAMRTDSSIFLSVQGELQPMADEYRSEIKLRYPAKKRKRSPAPYPTPPEPEGKPQNKVNLPKKPKPRPRTPLSAEREILVDWGTCKVDISDHDTKAYDILDEMCRLSSKETPISCLVMIRAFLELTIKKTARSLGMEFKKLSTTSKAVAKKLHDLEKLGDSEKLLINSYADTGGGLFTFNNIQSQVHSERFHPSQSRVNNYWTELEPFLAACWSQINESNLNERL